VIVEASLVVVRALASWLGELEGKATGHLMDAVAFAKTQTEVANQILAAVPPGASAEERQRALDTATALVAQGRAAVISAAGEVALAVPHELEKAWGDFGQTATNIATAIAQEARNTAWGFAAMALAFLYFWSKPARG